MTTPLTNKAKTSTGMKVMASNSTSAKSEQAENLKSSAQRSSQISLAVNSSLGLRETRDRQTTTSDIELSSIRGQIAGLRIANSGL